jgi:formate/nitrite transporter FocA (FNT family)
MAFDRRRSERRAHLRQVPERRDAAGVSEEKEERKASKKGVPEGETIYRSVRQDGEHALLKPPADLAWSGLAAGLSMGFSLIAEGLLRAHLPETAWLPLVSKFGYTAGFLIVVLGRQQLFTEQTLTAVLPLLSKDRPAGTFRNVARLWAIVLVSNIAGIAITTAMTVWTPAFEPDVHRAFSAIGNAALSHGFAATFVRAIYAGFVIATMIWLLPGAAAARLWIVFLLAYLVGVGEFSHIIAGSADALYVVFTGEHAFLEYLAGFFAPTLLGNALGGVVFVAALAHAQNAPEGSK